MPFRRWASGVALLRFLSRVGSPVFPGRRPVISVSRPVNPVSRPVNPVSRPVTSVSRPVTSVSRLVPVGASPPYAGAPSRTPGCCRPLTAWAEIPAKTGCGSAESRRKQAFSCFCARLSQTLLREDRLRLGRIKKKASFLLLLRSPFTIFAPAFGPPSACLTSLKTRNICNNPSGSACRSWC